MHTSTDRDSRVARAIVCAGLVGAAAMLCTSGAHAQGCFASTPYPVGVEPSCVIIADLNGDALNDLAVANHGLLLDNRISILMNNGDGTFAPSVYYDTGDRPYWIDSGDIDGDGDLDLAVSNYFDTTVSVFVNNGDGTFAPQITYDIGNGPGFVVFAPLDGDADLDLAVTNIIDDTLSVLMNKGDGSFGPQAAYAAGPGPYGLVAADFNGDGALDLVASNHHDATVSMLTNNGDGTFAPPVAYPVDPGPVGNDAADMNGDGFVDLVVANTEQGAIGTTISMLLNNGDGTLAPHVPYPAPTGPYTIKVSDFNADGVGDVAVCSEGNAVSVYLNNGDGTLAFPSSGTIGSNPVGLDVGDLDGNGTPEIAVTCYGSNEIWVLFNQYVGIAQQPLSQGVPLGGSAVFSVIATGPEPFTYQWRRDGVALVDDGNIAGANTDTLSIAAVVVADAGAYDVVVTNDCGSLVSAGAILDVVKPSCGGDIAPIGAPDGVVNIDDLLAVIGGWGLCADPDDCPADIAPAGGNDFVNIDDLLAVIGAWGPCP